MQTASGQFVGLLNFKAILHNKAFLLAFTNTGRFVGVCIPVLLVLSLGIAVSLAKQTAYAEILKTGKAAFSVKRAPECGREGSVSYGWSCISCEYTGRWYDFWNGRYFNC